MRSSSDNAIAMMKQNFAQMSAMQSAMQNRWLTTTTCSSPFQRRIELRLVKHSRQDQGPKNTRRATDPSTSGKGIKSLAN